MVWDCQNDSTHLALISHSLNDSHHRGCHEEGAEKHLHVVCFTTIFVFQSRSQKAACLHDVFL